jgi:hypothetical protein
LDMDLRLLQKLTHHYTVYTLLFNRSSYLKPLKG